MMNPLFPRQAGNDYHGHKIAFWFLGVVMLLRGLMGFNSIVNGEMVIRQADGIPLDTFPPQAAQTVVALFALLGLFHVVMDALALVTLVRYRALVPFLFALMLLEQLGKRVILMLLPIPRVGAPPGTMVNLIILALLATGLMFSLWRRQPQPAGAIAS